MQLKRFKYEVGGVTKDTAPLRIEPGESLILPIFAEASDTVLIHQQFRVAYVIYHHGVTPHSGHYQVALCSTRGGSAVTAWHFYICNDNCVPRLAQPADLRDIHHNGYLIGLVRDVPEQGALIPQSCRAASSRVPFRSEGSGTIGFSRIWSCKASSKDVQRPVNVLLSCPLLIIPCFSDSSFDACI